MMGCKPPRTDAEKKAEFEKRIRDALEGAEKARVRAVKRYDQCTDLLKNPSLSPEVERALKNACVFLRMGLLKFMSNPLDAPSCFARAETFWGVAIGEMLLPDAIRGEKVAGGNRNAAHATNARHIPLWEQRFEIMHKLVPTIGVDKAAAHCASEGLGSFDAIKRQWNRKLEAMMRDLVLIMGVDKAAAHCANEGFGSFEAIKEHWSRKIKKRGTPRPLSRK